MIKKTSIANCRVIKPCNAYREGKKTRSFVLKSFIAFIQFFSFDKNELKQITTFIVFFLRNVIY